MVNTDTSIRLQKFLKCATCIIIASYIIAIATYHCYLETFREFDLLSY